MKIKFVPYEKGKKIFEFRKRKPGDPVSKEIENLNKAVENFKKACLEVLPTVDDCVEKIRKFGIKAGKALRPPFTGTGHEFKKRKGLSCRHEWYGDAWSRCPKCGDIAAKNNF